MRLQSREPVKTDHWSEVGRPEPTLHMASVLGGQVLAASASIRYSYGRRFQSSADDISF